MLSICNTEQKQGSSGFLKFLFTQEVGYLGIKKAACLQKTDGIFLFLHAVKSNYTPFILGGVVEHKKSKGEVF
ncbi:MAG: hypothetical protein Q4D37_01625 [Oscillospiraceae bacterium]|nr:hypothetical protein [Oscillospiraceae bacterium]